MANLSSNMLYQILPSTAFYLLPPYPSPPTSVWRHADSTSDGAATSPQFIPLSYMGLGMGANSFSCKSWKARTRDRSHPTRIQYLPLHHHSTSLPLSSSPSSISPGFGGEGGKSVG